MIPEVPGIVSLWYPESQRCMSQPC